MPPSATAGPRVPAVLYEYDPTRREHSQLHAYATWLREHRGLALPEYPALHRWSVSEPEQFWQSIWDYFGVVSHSPHERVLGSRDMPGAQWFPGATLNWAEHCFRFPQDRDEVRIVSYSQTRPRADLTLGQIEEQVRRVAAGLRRLGVGRGDRVVAYLPNIPEAVVALYAVASLGAVFASCAPEFGAPSVIDRFAQVEPTVLLAVDGYTYGDKQIDRRAEVAQIRAALPTVQTVVHVPYGPHPLEDAMSWAQLAAPTDEPLTFEAVPFAHPLYVLFSSGTTGKPKAIVHGHGGILLEHLKSNALHFDLGPGDRLLWPSTTAWMLWNVLASCPLVRASMVLFDGNLVHPDLDNLWRIAQQTRPTMIGAGPAYLMQCRKEGRQPGRDFDLSTVRQLGASGSPLPVEGYRWCHEQFGDGVLLNVGSGGTDVCCGLIQAATLLPVYEGEMSAASLGVDAKAFDPQGNEVVGELGELVITAPMPSMPVGLWGDADGSRYRAAYFEDYPGVWRHGDWVRFSPAGTAVITGRSDATLNRGGVRLGTAEFYQVVEDLPEIAQSLVVHLEDPDGGSGELILFVVPTDGVDIDEQVRGRITQALRTALSPRHVPDLIEAVPAVPVNRTGKKLEIPVKRILQGADPESVAATGTLIDPSSLDGYVRLAARRRSPR
ncbi:MAG: acetoacetate--CoA ligase [Dermatophilaceae bacterium]